MTARRWPGLLLVPVLGVALWVGATDGGGPRTPVERANHIASEVACPECDGLSVAESDSPASAAVREEIGRQVDAGRTDDEVRSFLVGRYGKDILLRPDATGVGALVWALPVAGLVLAGAGLALAFWRWRSRVPGEVAEEDRALVAEALKR